MSDYKPYAAYKDSGVEWLGRVPEHWQLMPLKRLVRSIEQGWSPECESWPAATGEWGVLKVGCVNGGSFRPEENKALPLSLKPRPGLAICKGDVLVSRANTRELVGSCVPVPQDYPNLLLCDKIYRLRAGELVNPEFLAALITVHGRRAVEIEATGASSSMLNISQSVILDLPVALPEYSEQAQIIAATRRETARIDLLVEKKSRFIELLREKRQALIISVVTKGLDPNVRMKDSGVEWLGEVPEHWNVLQLRHTARLESGHTPSRSKPEYWVDCTTPWFTLADVWQVRSGEQKYVSETSEKVSQLGLENSSARLLPAGSVFLSRTASVGFPGIMAVDMATSQDFAVWTCSSELFNEYLYYVLLGMKPDFDRLMMGSTHKTIYMPDIEAIRLARPPLDEQRGIVSALSGQLDRFKIVIDKTERSIELLKERRSALITAAFTGQIDLREAE